MDVKTNVHLHFSAGIYFLRFSPLLTAPLLFTDSSSVPPFTTDKPGRLRGICYHLVFFF